jgi:cell division septation protein DedD
MYKELTGDRSVGGNIFYDGSEYMVQISSWRNNIIAEKEVQRMRKNGFDAFVVKAFVKKFKRTFYRVRIGGFKSKREALDFKKKNL